MQNLFKWRQTPPKNSELFQSYLETDAIKIIGIRSNEVDCGQWYEQSEDEWVLLVKGDAVVEFEDETSKLSAGDMLFIKSNRRHRVKRTSEDALWLAVHFNF